MRPYPKLKIKSLYLLGGGDFNGHVGKAMEEFKDIHSGFGIGGRNAEGVRLLEFCDECDLAAINTFLTKGKKHRYIYRRVHRLIISW